jgi:endonuclease YncB( thermonuclease family)
MIRLIGLGGLLSFCCLAWAVEPESIVGKIVAIADGDTLTLLDAGNRRHRIRLDGIDAPESKQAFGNRSRQSLGELVHQQEAVADCSKIDRYKRWVCIVKVDGLDVGLEQIKRGMAWHFKRYEAEQTSENRTAYSAAERAAKAEKLGLWRDSEPTPPWEFRTVKATTR